MAGKKLNEVKLLLCHLFDQIDQSGDWKPADEDNFDNLKYVFTNFILERRQERLLEESNSNSARNSEQTMDESSLKNPDFVPKTVFEKNISPGLLK